MYVRSYKSLPQGQPKSEEEKPLEIDNATQSTEETEQKKSKIRFKARRKMPEFHAPNEAEKELNHQNQRTHNPENEQKPTALPLFTQSEMLVLAIAVLLLLEGKDDILILALGYTLCP